jgi:HTH-type transcriptional repressor of NAD biosynthesis genes
MARETLTATGLVLGKFHPPTLGHCYLVDFARHYVSDLTVIVGTLEREEIPGALRVEWMRELFPGVRVVHLTDENPQYPHEHPDFWNIWRTSIRRLVPSGPDVVFASEDYGAALADALGAAFVPVDHARAALPVSGTAVRADPMAHWEFLPVPVRPYFVRRVCIIGPESTGKTTLALRLARHFNTVMVPEYARGLIDRLGGRVSHDAFPTFVRGQAASEAALARQANRVLICDSDALTTMLYRRLYVGDCPDYLSDAVERERYDLYLLADCDTPFVDDPQRNHPHARGWFFNQCVEWLGRRSAPFVVLRGGWDVRFEAARAAVEALIARRPGLASRTAPQA